MADEEFPDVVTGEGYAVAPSTRSARATAFARSAAAWA